MKLFADTLPNPSLMRHASKSLALIKRPNPAKNYLKPAPPFSRNQSSSSIRGPESSYHNPVKDIRRQTQTIEKVQRRKLISRLHHITQSQRIDLQRSQIPKLQPEGKHHQELPEHPIYERDRKLPNPNHQFEEERSIQEKTDDVREIAFSPIIVSVLL